MFFLHLKLFYLLFCYTLIIICNNIVIRVINYTILLIKTTSKTYQFSNSTTNKMNWNIQFFCNNKVNPYWPWLLG